MTTAQVGLPGDPQSAGAARRFLADTLDAWGHGDYEFAAVLVLSELVTNAVLHARTDIVVRLVSLDRALRIEVRDGSTRAPMARNYSADATTGRGLTLVDTLARDWGVEVDGTGKVVWCELAESDADDAPGPDTVFRFDVDDDDDGDWVTAGGPPRFDTQALAA